MRCAALGRCESRLWWGGRGGALDWDPICDPGRSTTDLLLLALGINLQGEEGLIDDVGVEAVFAKRIALLKDIAHLAGIDDAEAVDIPMDGVGNFSDPPVHVLADADKAPFQFF